MAKEAGLLICFFFFVILYTNQFSIEFDDLLQLICTFNDTSIFLH